MPERQRGIGAEFAQSSAASSKLRVKGQVRLKRLLVVFFLFYGSRRRRLPPFLILLRFFFSYYFSGFLRLQSKAGFIPLLHFFISSAVPCRMADSRLSSFSFAVPAEGDSCHSSFLYPLLRFLPKEIPAISSFLQFLPKAISVTLHFSFSSAILCRRQVPASSSIHLFFILFLVSFSSAIPCRRQTPALSSFFFPPPAGST